MISLIPVDAKRFKKENLKFIRRTYEKADLRFIVSGMIDYESFYNDFNEDDLNFIRKNFLFIKNEQFDLNDCLTQFVRYNEHILKDDRKIILLEDDIVISLTRIKNDIKTLSIDDILLIEIYEEKIKNPNYNYLYFQQNSNLISSIFLSFNRKFKKNELILNDITPVFNFKYLKKLVNENIILLSKKVIVESLINIFSLNIRKKTFPGIKLTIYFNDHNLQIPNILNDNVFEKITTNIYQPEKNVRVNEKPVIQFILGKNINNIDLNIFKTVINLFNNSNKYDILINGRFPFYENKTATEPYNNIYIYDNSENSKILKNQVILSVGILNEEMINNINENKISYFLENKDEIYKDITTFKDIIFQQDDYNLIKLFKFNDTGNNLFVSPYFSRRTDTPINIYENIKKILSLI